MSTLKAVRGTRDLLPPETALWNRIEATARDVFARYNFGEIRTPVFEDTGLFARGVGEETDIVSKEMYTWSDGERFEKRKMLDDWLNRNRADGSHVQVDKVHVQHPRIEEELIRLGVDLVVMRGIAIPGQILPSHCFELVRFAPEISDSQISVLIQAKDLVLADTQREFQARVIPRLVVPTSVSLNSWVGPREVVIEQLQGQFFASSQSLTLRPENTAGVVRAYIENKLGESGLLQKLYYIGPQFRRERPQ